MSAEESCRPRVKTAQDRGCVGVVVGSSKPSGTCISSPCVLDARHEAIGFNVFLLNFWSCFGPIFSIPLFLPFGMDMFSFSIVP